MAGGLTQGRTQSQQPFAMKVSQPTGPATACRPACFVLKICGGAGRQRASEPMRSRRRTRRSSLTGEARAGRSRRPSAQSRKHPATSHPQLEGKPASYRDNLAARRHPREVAKVGDKRSSEGQSIHSRVAQVEIKEQSSVNCILKKKKRFI